MTLGRSLPTLPGCLTEGEMERFLDRYDQNTVMISTSIPIQFNHQGINYAGWATPSAERHEDGYPKHYAMVLNGSFFGNFRCYRGRWIVDQWKPYELVVAAGERLGEWIIATLKKFA